MTSYAPGDLPALDWKQSVIEYLKRSLSKGNLKTFKEQYMNNSFPHLHERYEIQEIKPPRDGIAYSCNYSKHVPISRTLLGYGDSVNIERYWDKDGNCIGFSFEGQKFMLQENEYKIPENSELSKFLDMHPGAHVEEKENKFYVTYVGIMPYDGPVERNVVFDKNGNFIDNSRSHDIKKSVIAKAEKHQDDITDSVQQNQWNLSVIAFLKQFLPKQNLEMFKKDLERMNTMSPNNHYEIREIKPPRNGIAYSCAYDKHTMVSKPPMKSSYAHIEQYWDKDGNCIGFKFEGQQFMFSSKNNQVETTLPQNMQDALNTYWKNRANVRSLIPKDSDLEKFIKKHPLANINIKTNKDGTIHTFEVVYDTRMGQVGRRGKFGILYGEMIENYATFDWSGTFISESERTRDAGIKSANFKSGQEKIKTKNKVKQASVIKTATNDR